MYLIDTNVISAARRPERAPRVAAWLKDRPDDALYLSAITIGEITHGVRLQERQNPKFAADLSAWLAHTTGVFTDRISAFHRTGCRNLGAPLGRSGHTGADLMIAAQALARGWTVVTGNVSDFTPTGVAVENPV